MDKDQDLPWYSETHIHTGAAGVWGFIKAKPGIPPFANLGLGIRDVGLLGVEFGGHRNE